jgi:hypothetical protein
LILALDASYAATARPCHTLVQDDREGFKLNPKVLVQRIKLSTNDFASFT